MRILYVTASLPHGPGETFILPEIHELLRRGHELRIAPVRPTGGLIHEHARALRGLTLDGSLASPRVFELACGEVWRHGRSALDSLRSIVGGGSLKTLAVNAAVSPKALSLARLIRDWRPEHIHAHWATHPATVAMVLAKALGVPWSLTTHRYDVVADNLLGRKVRSAVFTRFISERTQALAATALKGLSADRYGVIRVGIDLPEPPGPPPARAPRRRTLLCAARFVPVKGHEFLIRAMKEVARTRPDARLLLAGDGPLRSHLEEQARACGVAGCVEFLGQQPHESLLDLYRRKAVDGVVLPSIDAGHGEHEGIPVALVEAMAHGVPVVATDTGGISELLGGGAGILVEQRNPAALAAALSSVLSDEAAWGRLALAGRAAVERHHDVRRIVDRLERVFVAVQPPSAGVAHAP